MARRHGDESSMAPVVLQLRANGYSLRSLNGMPASEVMSRPNLPLPQNGTVEMDIKPNSKPLSSSAAGWLVGFL